MQRSMQGSRRRVSLAYAEREAVKDQRALQQRLDERWGENAEHLRLLWVKARR